MSTRSNVIIEDLDTGDNICLYRHCDGYFSGAGFDLLIFAKKMEQHHIENVNELADELKKANLGYRDSEMGLHSDIEYLYKLLIKDGKIQDVKALIPHFEAYSEKCISIEDVTDKLNDEFSKSKFCQKLNMQSSPCIAKTNVYNSNFIELTNAGSLKIEKIFIRKTAIMSVVKTENGKYGCIVQVMGEKYPVVEKYEDVLKMIMEN